ncbi:trimethylamine N-oxide reductase I catalytic subunit [Enterobacter asburiae]|nr:trimethylamine N-oxide reductase I catalytic subunit [Enterobacter asburiae]
MSTSTKTILTAAHWGPMLVETDGENVLSSRGALPTQHSNSLQTVVRDQVHSKTRVRWPMVRKGFWPRRISHRGFAVRMSLFA